VNKWIFEVRLLVTDHGILNFSELISTTHRRCSNIVRSLYNHLKHRYRLCTIFTTPLSLVKSYGDKLKGQLKRQFYEAGAVWEEKYEELMKIIGISIINNDIVGLLLKALEETIVTFQKEKERKEIREFIDRKREENVVIEEDDGEDFSGESST